MNTFQNEWDALVLETFALKQQHNSTRQELSYALYAQDAASRVIARLVRERDAAREYVATHSSHLVEKKTNNNKNRALANVQATFGGPANGGDVSMAEEGDDAAAEPETAALPQHILDKIEETQQALSSTRKKRKVLAGYTTPAQIKTFVQRHVVSSLHSPSPAGINALALSRLSPGQFVTGGNDKIVQLYDHPNDKVLATLKAHSKRVTHVALREHAGEPTLVLSAGADKLAHVWAHEPTDEDEHAYVLRAALRTHSGELTGLSVHPTSALVALASLDRTYSLHELSGMKEVYRSKPSDDVFTALDIHPDGALLAVGTQTSRIQVCDVRTGRPAAYIAPPEESAGQPFTVGTLSFSENGYHLLAPNGSSSVAIWDLRKMTVAHSISLGESFEVSRVRYDWGAQYFAVSGNEGVRVFAHKTWQELARFDDVDQVTDVVFGERGKEIWATSRREVKIWGLPEST